MAKVEKKNNIRVIEWYSLYKISTRNIDERKQFCIVYFVEDIHFKVIFQSIDYKYTYLKNRRFNSAVSTWIEGQAAAAASRKQRTAH